MAIWLPPMNGEKLVVELKKLPETVVQNVIMARSSATAAPITHLFTDLELE